MGLREYVARNRVLILKSKTKKGAISELVRAAVKGLPGITHADLSRSVWEREALLTTRIAPEIAIPHARIAGLNSTIIAVGKSHAGIIYDRLDRNLVHLFFLIVGGEQTHLKALGAVASMLQSTEACARLMAVNNLPSGLGARHAVAASITAVTGAVTVAVSESTRKISLFQAGDLVMDL